MKRLIVAVALALSTAPALADVGAPFEQNQLDRALPTLPESVTAQLDRGSLGTPERVLLTQIGGMSYKSGTEESESVWATDHNFIAPAQ